MGRQKDHPKSERKRRIGKWLERDWLDVIAESATLLVRLAVRGIRSFFD